jgi:uncharacterized protein (DUF433 family)
MAADVIGAFSEEHTAELAGVSRDQLRQWDKLGLLRPSYGAETTGLPYGRVYSFRDLVSARVLGQLRNEHRVPIPHLRETFGKLSRLTDAPWSSTVLFVLNRRIVIAEPGQRFKRDIISGQQVLNIPLKVVITGVRQAVLKLNQRSEGEVGKIVHGKFVAQNQAVISGTRIPVAAIKSFVAAGYDVAHIVKEYPSLTASDVQAAVAYPDDSAAA